MSPSPLNGDRTQGTEVVSALWDQTHHYSVCEAKFKAMSYQKNDKCCWFVGSNKIFEIIILFMYLYFDNVSRVQTLLS